MNKIFKSIDGYFEKKLVIDEIKDLNFKKKKKINSIVGKGNSISKIPFVEDVELTNVNLSNYYKLNKKKNSLEVNANASVVNVHNFLLKEGYFAPYFPSYPLVTIGACIANGSHGISPKNGLFNDYVESIKIYNPNFGFKELSKKKNQKLFLLTKSGLGLTGIILSAKIKVKKLSGTLIKIKKYDFNDIFKCYKFMKKSKHIYNQNSFTVDAFSKKIFKGRLITGEIVNKKNKIQILKEKKIPIFRIGLLSSNILKSLIFRIIFFLENIKIFLKDTQHLNDILFTSNKRTSYFFLMSKKFVEHQVIIPHKYVRKYLTELEILIKKNNPNITLIHLKIFSGVSKNLEFNGNGLALAMHINNNNSFKLFFEKLIKLDKKFNCKVCIYKNSEINLKLAKYYYNSKLKNFKKSIDRINTKYKFTNNLFGKNINDKII